MSRAADVHGECGLGGLKWGQSSSSIFDDVKTCALWAPDDRADDSSFFAIVRRFSQGLRVSWVTPGLNWRGSLWETMDFLQWTLNLQVRRNKFIKIWTQITTIAHNDNYFGEVLGCLYPCLTVIWNKGTRLVNTKTQKCRSWPWGHDTPGCKTGDFAECVY